MIRIDSIWLATDPMDMRAGTETALARVIAVFGAAKRNRPAKSPTRSLQ
ncbi:transposase [Pseudomonas syringae]|nr:transposase [Pseudomonas syringae]